MKRYKKAKRYRAILRATAVVPAVLMLVGGVTFAMLRSQQNVLTGNTISTTTANLQISLDNDSYSNSRTGFDFSNIVPGGAAVPSAGYSFYLRNSGGTPLSIKVAVPTPPTNPNGVDLSKVNVLITTVGNNAGTQTFTLQSLISAAASGGVSASSRDLDFSMNQVYKIQVSMAADAINGPSASLSNLDFVFTGVVPTT